MQEMSYMCILGILPCTGTRTCTCMQCELVRLGDTSADSYEKLIMLFEDNLATMASFEETRDGLALEDRPVPSKRKQAANHGEGTGETV